MAILLNDKPKAKAAESAYDLPRFNPRERKATTLTVNNVAPIGVAKFRIKLNNDDSPEEMTVEFASMATADEIHVSLRSDFFLRNLYAYSSAEETEEYAIDSVYDYLSAVIARGDFEECDAILRYMDESRVTPAVIASVLTTTASLRQISSERSEFFRRSKLHLDTVRDPASNVQLLAGLA